ncbi:uncharacterized protein BDR25DRAFT_350178 [Lindgomyces ingoldianus]|uniref:Uncharacterized protein n=1 Tax=Lindgomyces ingoldianus TaxID=673940 RepID=A0ACB6RB01_9PLEO|nr:uncharacterized protein BDR25DRAFT_350178 [Lindgomyces ingoldianus]KAF2475900.1 hypothetical protein BDR25DRAFT_350178 [Lindgomyces ingoldianus]
MQSVIPPSFSLHLKSEMSTESQKPLRLTLLLPQRGVFQQIYDSAPPRLLQHAQFPSYTQESTILDLHMTHWFLRAAWRRSEFVNLVRTKLSVLKRSDKLRADYICTKQELVLVAGYLCLLELHPPNLCSNGAATPLGEGLGYCPLVGPSTHRQPEALTNKHLPRKETLYRRKRTQCSWGLPSLAYTNAQYLQTHNLTPSLAYLAGAFVYESHLPKYQQCNSLDLVAQFPRPAELSCFRTHPIFALQIRNPPARRERCHRGDKALDNLEELHFHTYTYVRDITKACFIPCQPWNSLNNNGKDKGVNEDKGELTVVGKLDNSHTDRRYSRLASNNTDATASKPPAGIPPGLVVLGLETCSHRTSSFPFNSGSKTGRLLRCVAIAVGGGVPWPGIPRSTRLDDDNAFEFSTVCRCRCRSGIAIHKLSPIVLYRCFLEATLFLLDSVKLFDCGCGYGYGCCCLLRSTSSFLWNTLDAISIKLRGCSVASSTPLSRPVVFIMPSSCLPWSTISLPLRNYRAGARTGAGATLTAPFQMPLTESQMLSPHMHNALMFVHLVFDRCSQIDLVADISPQSLAAAPKPPQLSLPYGISSVFLFAYSSTLAPSSSPPHQILWMFNRTPMPQSRLMLYTKCEAFAYFSFGPLCYGLARSMQEAGAAVVHSISKKGGGVGGEFGGHFDGIEVDYAVVWGAAECPTLGPKEMVKVKVWTVFVAHAGCLILELLTLGVVWLWGSGFSKPLEVEVERRRWEDEARVRRIRHEEIKFAQTLSNRMDALHDLDSEGDILATSEITTTLLEMTIPVYLINACLYFSKQLRSEGCFSAFDSDIITMSRHTVERAKFLTASFRSSPRPSCKVEIEAKNFLPLYSRPPSFAWRRSEILNLKKELVLTTVRYPLNESHKITYQTGNLSKAY